MHEQKTTIVQDVADLYRAAGFEVREPSELDPAGQFAIAGSLDAAGVFVETLLAHTGSAAPTDWKGAAEWLRNNYQDHDNVASLCDAMIVAQPVEAAKHATPEGFTLVPAFPTPEMLDAAGKAEIPKLGRDFDMKKVEAATIYRAMLRAAPFPPDVQPFPVAQPVEAAGRAAKAVPAGWDDSWKVVIGAAAALAQIHIEDEDEREAMMVHVRKIVSAIPKLDAQPAPECSAQAASWTPTDNLRRTLTNIKDATRLADVRSLANLGLSFLDAAPATAQVALNPTSIGILAGLWGIKTNPDIDDAKAVMGFAEGIAAIARIGYQRTAPTENAAAPAYAPGSDMELERALDAEYPIPDNPHASVIERAHSNRAAFERGWNAKSSAAAPADLSKVTEMLRDVHDALEGTADSDIDHFEDDEEEREGAPVQYAARKVMEVIDLLATHQPTGDTDKGEKS